MAKAYWVATYRSISNPDALAAYAKLAGPAIQAGGGRLTHRLAGHERTGFRPHCAVTPGVPTTRPQ